MGRQESRGAPRHVTRCARPYASPRLTLALAAALLCACAQTEEIQAVPDDAPIHHAIHYIEIPVTDMAAARAFYGAAFDWAFNDYGPEYAGIRKGEGEAGGLRLVTEASEVTRGGPLVILFSTDLDDTLARVRAAGGRVVVEPFDFPGGRRFQFLDPSGNELAVWAAP